MGVTRSPRRPRPGTAAWGLTMLTLAVAAAALVFAVLNAGRTGDDLASRVHAALEPAHVSIWLAERP